MLTSKRLSVVQKMTFLVSLPLTSAVIFLCFWRTDLSEMNPLLLGHKCILHFSNYRLTVILLVLLLFSRLSKSGLTKSGQSFEYLLGRLPRTNILWSKVSETTFICEHVCKVMAKLLEKAQYIFCIVKILLLNCIWAIFNYKSLLYSQCKKTFLVNKSLVLAFYLNFQKENKKKLIGRNSRSISQHKSSKSINLFALRIFNWTRMRLWLGMESVFLLARKILLKNE